MQVHSNDGFTRYTGEMSNKSGDLYEFNFDVDPDRIKIRLNIQVIIIRSTTIYPEDNLKYATIQSSKIAWSKIKLYLKEKPLTGGLLIVDGRILKQVGVFQ